jgi:uncharacterized protein (TIGR02246 family)
LVIDNYLAHSFAAASGDARLDSAIQKANSEFLTATKTSDAATIAAPYTDNAAFVLPDGACIQSRAEIEKMYRTRFEQYGLPEVTKLDSKNVILDGDVAYESGNAEITNEGRQAGKKNTSLSRYLTIWRHIADGEWKVVRNIVPS